MIDTNIFISLMLSPEGRVSSVIKAIVQEHALCAPSFCLWELEEVVRRKWPHKLAQIDAFLQRIPYEIVRTPDVLPEIPYIRDDDDRPILATAIFSEADVLLTGDKDFEDVVIKHPKIMTPAQFAATYL
jgi:putative PIN family toxin of toxin-antitoxin system